MTAYGKKLLAGIFMGAAVLLASGTAQDREFHHHATWHRHVTPPPPPGDASLTKIFGARAVTDGKAQLSTGFLNGNSAHPEADMAIWAASRNSPLPQDLINIIVRAESAYVITADPKTSTACGLTQMIDIVLFEKLYEYGDQYGFNGKAYIEKFMAPDADGHIVPNYRIRDNDPAHYQSVRKLCTDPYFASVMGMEHLRDTVFNMQTNLNHPITYTQAYMGYVFGSDGGTRLVRASESRHGANKPAASLVGSGAVRANHNLFYAMMSAYMTGRGRHKHKHPAHLRARTVAELFKIFERKIGPGTVLAMEARPMPIQTETPPMPDGGVPPSVDAIPPNVQPDISPGPAPAPII